MSKPIRAVTIGLAAAVLSCAPPDALAGPDDWRTVPAVPGRGISLVGDWRAPNGDFLRVAEPLPGQFVGTLVRGAHPCFRAGDEVMRATAHDSIPSRWDVSWLVAWSAAGRPSLPFQPANASDCARTNFEPGDATYGLSSGGLVICLRRACLREALPPIAADGPETLGSMTCNLMYIGCTPCVPWWSSPKGGRQYCRVDLWSPSGRWVPSCGWQDCRPFD